MRVESMDHLAAVVAVLEDRRDILELWRLVLMGAGFRAVLARVSDFRHRGRSLTTFMNEHDPDVVIYDISPPHADRWELFQRQLAEAIHPRPVVVTTTNKGMVDAFPRAAAPLTILAKPFGVHQMLRAVREALTREHNASDAPADDHGRDKTAG